MGDTSKSPPPHVPPTHFSTIANSARDLIYRGFVGGQMLSVSCLGPCGTMLTSSATIAHSSSIGSMSATLMEGPRRHSLTFSTLNNQVYTLMNLSKISSSIQFFEDFEFVMHMIFVFCTD